MKYIVFCLFISGCVNSHSTLPPQQIDPINTDINVDRPYIDLINHAKMWMLHGRLHRVGGPAIEYENGDREWYYNNELHKSDGPAIERANGNNEWYIHGHKVAPPFYQTDLPDHNVEYYCLNNVDPDLYCKLAMK